MLRMLYCGIIAVLAVVSRVDCFGISELERFIEDARLQWDVPGVAVSIVHEDQVIFLKGFGVVRIDKSEKVDENTIFQLASITKTFTAAALGVQVDLGLLKWDEEIIKNLPQCALKEPYSTRYATARDLLAHRTGLPSFGGDLLGKLGYSSPEILFRIRYIEPVTSFRNSAHYSNVGFFVAGELLESVGKKSWKDLVVHTLFTPLSMLHSGFASDLDKANVAFAHAKIDGKIQVIPWDQSGGFPAAGAITSTAADMANWMLMHVNGGSFKGKQILKPETVKEMLRPSMVGEVSFSESAPIDENSSFSYGLGWNNYQYKGKMIVEKGGALDGVRTVVTLIPELKMGICVLCNLNLTLLPEAIRAKFLELQLGKSTQDVQEAIKTQSKEIAKLLNKEPKPKDALPSAHKVEQFTGVFESPLYGSFKIVSEKGQLILEAGPAKWKGVLTHWSNDTFLLEWPAINAGNEQVTFTFGPENRAIEIQTQTLGLFRRKTDTK